MKTLFAQKRQTLHPSRFIKEKFSKDLKTKKSLSNYNHNHNIMRIFDVLPNFPLTTSETKPDY